MGFSVVYEPGLRVIQRGGPKPWDDLSGFVEAVTQLCYDDLRRAQHKEETVFFDRGLLDALSGKAEREKRLVAELLPAPFPYAEPVFYAPPWPEIFENTPDRRLPFEVAEEEAIRLRRDLDLLNIKTLDLPRISAEMRVDFVLSELGLS